MDAIGTPYCITIDHQTLQDDTVTIRDRDTMKQERVAISPIKSIIQESVSLSSLLKKI
jgi:glycyl-tRNA synthetase